MTFTSSVHGVDHVERATRGTALRCVVWFYVDGEELCGESSLFHTIDVGAIGDRWRATEIKIIVRHRRCDVVMTVDDDCFALNLESAFPELLVAWLLLIRSSAALFSH